MAEKTPIERAMDDLSAQFSTDLFAETVVFTDKDKVEYEIPAHVNRDGPYQEPYVRGEGIATCEIEVKVSDVSDPLQYGETFTFDDYVWEFNPVLGITHKDSHFLIIALERQLT